MRFLMIEVLFPAVKILLEFRMTTDIATETGLCTAKLVVIFQELPQNTFVIENLLIF